VSYEKKHDPQSRETLFQSKFIINDFFIPSLELPIDSFWVKDDEILLKPHERGIMAFVVEKIEDPEHTITGIEAEKKLEQYVKICSLITGHTPTIDGGSGNPIQSINEVGKNKEMFKVVFGGIKLTEAQKQQISPYFQKFLEESKRLYDKYRNLSEKFIFLATALKYYYKAQARKEWETAGNFLDATIALEALLNDGAFDLKYKISTRASFILGSTGIAAFQDTIKVFETVRKYYDMRSDVIHGGSKEPDFQAFTTLVEYVRWLLICFYVLAHARRQKDPFKTSSKTMKKNLIKEIDYAILDDTRRKLFKEEIADGIKDFQLKIPRSFVKEGEWRISW
jgi:hypothetical protein